MYKHNNQKPYHQEKEQHGKVNAIEQAVCSEEHYA
jgi:hypothetical protein